MKKIRCLICRCVIPLKRNPNQRYCSKVDCQKQRMRRWRRRKYQKDPDYRDNQRAAQQRWQRKHPHYWRHYRAKNIEYSTRNRQLQRTRNQHQTTRTPIIAFRLGGIANINALNSKYPNISVSFGPVAFANWKQSKSNAFPWPEPIVTGVLEELSGYCKETTL